jgi:hypothetical protein
MAVSPTLLALLVVAAGSTAAPRPVHRVTVHVAGPLALVEVERSVEPGTAPAEQVLDLGLPEGAALVDLDLVMNGRLVPVPATSEAAGRAAHATALSERGLAPSRVPLDPGTNLRIHLAPATPGARLVVRYRYTVAMACAGGRFVLRVPPSLEDNPTAAQVRVVFDGLPPGVRLAEATAVGVPARIRGSGRGLSIDANAPARGAWEIGYSLAGRAGGFPAQVVAARARRPRQGAVMAARARRPRQGGKAEDLLAVGMCRPARAAARVAPATLWLVVDRSSSVGQGGMSGQRVLMRALIEALPPSVRFNAVFFGRGVEELFRLPRAATREAIEALVAAADPNRLENGSDLASALRKAAAGLRLEPPSAGQRDWMVLVSDGALPESQGGEALAAALGNDLDGRVEVLGLLVRPAADDPVPAEAVARIQRAAQGLGGVVRTVSPDTPRETIREILAAMGQGGDVLGVSLEGGAPAGLAGGLAPGAGATRILAVPAARKRPVVRAHLGTALVRAPLAVTPVACEWLLRLADAARGRTWSVASAEISVLAEDVTRQPASASHGVARGRMDPLVLRNALALAFMPRARACYVTRRVEGSADLALRGRLRLALEIERGELLEARVRSSELGRPDIEACVREAAFAIEYPRPMHRDAPTVANLSLVFRPRTPAESSPDASPLDREIELLVGPVTFDPGSLVEVEAGEE